MKYLLIKKKEKKELKIIVNEFISNSEFECEVVGEIAKAIDGNEINKIKIEIIRGNNKSANYN